MNREKCLKAGFLLAVFLVTISLILWGVEKYQDLRQRHDQAVQTQLLNYIASANNVTFDFVKTAEQFDLSYGDLRDHLLHLERNGMIKCTPRYSARKPIIFTLDDMKWYFHTISVVHPNDDAQEIAE